MKMELGDCLEWIDEEISWRKQQFRKPTHGTCCTCQTCGNFHDDCVCLAIDVLEEISRMLDLQVKELET